MTPTHDKPAIVPRDSDLPPPRPGVRYVTVPMLGIVIATDRRRRRVDRFFHWPMIVLALAILPLLVIELVYLERIPVPARTPVDRWLGIAVQVGFAVIWLAFLVEFVIKVAIAESRVEYVRRNWLDVVIILVPVLRPVRAARLARTARVLKLRGVGMKVARLLFTVVIGLDATERLLRRVGVKMGRELKHPDKMTRHELVCEVKRLRTLEHRWDEWYDDHQEYIEIREGGELPPKPVGKIVDVNADADADPSTVRHAPTTPG